MALLRDFSVGRPDLNPQNSTLFLRFKSDARLELTQNSSFVDGHDLPLLDDKRMKPYQYMNTPLPQHLVPEPA
jgi:hypothetical protein